MSHHHHTAGENLPPQVLQRVARELRELVRAPPTGIRYLPQTEELLTEIHVELAGPETTPYEGGFFEIKLTLGDTFPSAPPKGHFVTKIFHPNIATATGEICVNTLKRDWHPRLGLAHVLQVIRCLLIVPFPESSLNDEAGRLFMESYDEYARRARLWTSIHAPKASAIKDPPLPTAKATDQPTTTTTDAKEVEPAAAAATTAQAPTSSAPKQAAADNATSTSRSHAQSDPPSGAAAAATAAAGAKRASPTSTDAAAHAPKKKSMVKKGLKRL